MVSVSAERTSLSNLIFDNPIQQEVFKGTQGGRILVGRSQLHWTLMIRTCGEGNLLSVAMNMECSQQLSRKPNSGLSVNDEVVHNYDTCL